MSLNGFKVDCAQFKSDRPCGPHKATGQRCEECGWYRPQEVNVLVLKFDAIGDVLRTTSILPGIKQAHPNVRVTWFTKKQCEDLLANNGNVDEVLYLDDPGSIWRLKAQVFDVIYSLDPSPMSAAIAKGLNGRKVVGFTVNDFGKSVPATTSAEEWYKMGLDDRLKTENGGTFFQHLYRLAELEYRREYKPQVFLGSEERERGLKIGLSLGKKEGKKVVGINPGAGSRWRYKKWNEEHYSELLNGLSAREDCRFVLLGGVEDDAVLQKVQGGLNNPELVPIAPKGTIRDFLVWISAVDVLICGDTLALHAATALEKQVIALFGPTSEQEIDLFGRGKKLWADVPCRCCYLPSCKVRPTCMDLLEVGRVREALLEILSGFESRNGRVNGAGKVKEEASRGRVWCEGQPA